MELNYICSTCSTCLKHDSDLHTSIQDDVQFLAEAARVLLEYGHASSALEVCHMTSSSYLHVVKLEALGALNKQASMESLVKEVGLHLTTDSVCMPTQFLHATFRTHACMATFKITCIHVFTHLCTLHAVL